MIKLARGEGRGGKKRNEHNITPFPFWPFNVNNEIPPPFPKTEKVVNIRKSGTTKKHSFFLGNRKKITFLGWKSCHLEQLPVGDVPVPIHVVDPEEELQLLLPVLVAHRELGQAVHELWKGKM